jgi:hypothetical protein
MSKLYYDHLIAYEDIEIEIDKISQTKEEREELWQIVDEMIHHKVLDLVLSKLPKDKHQEFMEKFVAAPHDEGLFDYLNEKIGDDVEKLIKKELDNLAKDILKDLRQKK